MRSKIRCPACRKGVAVSAADAGQPVLCLACGRTFDAPPDLAAAAVPAPAGPAAAETGAVEVASRGPDWPIEATDEAPAAVAAAPADETGSQDLAAAAAAAAAASKEAVPASSPREKASGPAVRPGGHVAVAAKRPPKRTAAARGEPAARGVPLAWLGWALAAGLGVAWVIQTLTAPAKSPLPARPELVASASAPAATRPARITPDRAPGVADQSEQATTTQVAPGEVDAVAASGMRDPADAGFDPAAGAERADAASPGTVAAPDTSNDVAGDADDAEDAAPPATTDEDAAVTLEPSPPPPGAWGAGWRPIRRHRGPLRPLPPATDEVSDEQIEAAIRRAVEYLSAQFDDEHRLPPEASSGVHFLVTYALVQAGTTIQDPLVDPRGDRIDGLIDRMKTLPVEPIMSTYERSVRAAALAVLNRPQDRETLEEDVRRLVAGHTRGAYSYVLPGDQRGGRIPEEVRAAAADNSNSQYGLLGVWSGAEAGIRVSYEYWEAVNKHWVATQLAGGAWAYSSANGASETARTGYVSMAAAGTASLFVTFDQMTRRAGALGRDPFPPALERALRWWETNDDWRKPVDPNNPWGDQYWGYQLYGIERVGLASGFKYFGPHDWYRVLAGQVVDAQLPDGSWYGGNLIQTSYALLFLARGRPPLMMNKLRFDGFWANRPRDLANLARFATRSTERPLNWQVVDLRTEWHDWLDAPILYLASHVAPDLGDEERDKLRSFALAGGMIFTHADGGRKPFDEFAVKLARELFPQYEMVDLPPDHPVYNLMMKVEPKPKLRAVSNGSRILLLHSPTDLSQAWQGREEKKRANLFNLGLNLFVYATGKRDLRSRLDSPYVPPPRQVRGPEGAAVRVARLRYAGHWDPEPVAWERFSRLFLQRTGTPLKPVTVKWENLRPDDAPMAYLTGTALYAPTAAEVAALKAYVEAGGVLLVDTCGGTGAFAAGLKGPLAEAFPSAVLDPVPPTHPALNPGPPGMADVRRPKYRPFAAGRQGNRPGLYGFRAGRGQVILTTLDITSGLLHTGSWGIYGYDPTYCEALVQNIAFWAHDTAPE